MLRKDWLQIFFRGLAAVQYSTVSTTLIVVHTGVWVSRCVKSDQKFTTQLCTKMYMCSPLAYTHLESQVPVVVQFWAIFCPSAEYLFFFSKTFPRLVLDIWGPTLFLWGKILHQLICSLAVVFVQASFNLLALSTYPVFLCFLHCLLNPPVCFRFQDISGP